MTVATKAAHTRTPFTPVDRIILPLVLLLFAPVFASRPLQIPFPLKYVVYVLMVGIPLWYGARLTLETFRQNFARR